MYGAKKLSPKQRTHLFCVSRAVTSPRTHFQPRLLLINFPFLIHLSLQIRQTLSSEPLMNNVNNATSKKVLAHCRRLAAVASAAAASKRSRFIDTSDEVESDHEELEEFSTLRIVKR